MKSCEKSVLSVNYNKLVSKDKNIEHLKTPSTFLDGYLIRFFFCNLLLYHLVKYTFIFVVKYDKLKNDNNNNTKLHLELFFFLTVMIYHCLYCEKRNIIFLHAIKVQTHKPLLIVEL